MVAAPLRSKLVLAGGAGTLADFELAQKQAESRWNPEDDTSKPDADGMKELAGVSGGHHHDAPRHVVRSLCAVSPPIHRRRVWWGVALSLLAG